MRNYLSFLVCSALVGCTYIPVLLTDEPKPAVETASAAGVEVTIKPPEVVLDAGLQVKVGQEMLTIWGEDPCQPGFSGNTKLNCIQLTNRTKVRVHFIRNGMLDVEDWMVTETGGRYVLRNPANLVVLERFQ